MSRKKLISDRDEIMTIDRVAAMGGFANVCSVYTRVNAGKPIAGRQWQWEGDEPIESDGVAATAKRPLHPRIFCDCEACGADGQYWKASRVQALHPSLNGAAITPKTIERVRALTGHNFRFEGDDVAPAAEWRKNGEPHAELSRAPEYSARTINSLSELMPINPKGPGLLFTAWGVPTFYAPR